MNNVSLLSSTARIQAPWVKVVIGDYTFGVFNRKAFEKDRDGNYIKYKTTFPNYVQSLNITKINGQINQYTLVLTYPITQEDDPNFFEKVFSSVSKSRKIIFTYGDATIPSFTYKDEEAIITKISQSFDLKSSSITYNVEAVSSASLASSGNHSFIDDGKKHKPSDIIKSLFNEPKYHLKEIFTGMSSRLLDFFIAGDDEAVELDTKTNISILNYLNYLVSCMVPTGTTTNSNIANDIYILTIHDETSYDSIWNDESFNGPYFKVTRTSYRTEQSDAFVLDIGYNTSTIVSQFNIENNENYSLFYDYQKRLYPASYVERINEDGKWERVYAPASTTGENFTTDPDNITWWTKITKFPINASVTVQGLLRPAMLMTHVRLNVIFPGGHKHIASGLYIVTKQVDSISGSGYKTTLNLTKISGDPDPSIN